MPWKYVLVISASLFAQTTAHADKSEDTELKMEAEKHFNLALGHYEAKEFADAARELAQAHAIDPRTSILFAWAQAERLSGNCEKATELYHQLRRKSLPDQDRLGVLEGLERCGAFEQADRKKAAAVAKAEEESERARNLAGSPWYSDWVGDTLLVSGFISLGVGASYWRVSSTEGSDAKSAFGYEEHLALETRAREHRTVSILALAAGGSLIVGSIARYIMRDDGSERVPQRAPVTTWLTKGGGGIAIGGSL